MRPLPYYPNFEQIATTNAAAAELEHEFWTLVTSLADEYGPDAERVAAEVFGDLCGLVLADDGMFVPDHDPDLCGCGDHAPWCPYNPAAPDVDAYIDAQEQREIERLDQLESERDAEDQP